MAGSKWIAIEDDGESPSGKTKRWRVVNVRTGETCGKIKWYGGFRRYVFYPSDGFLFDHHCLGQIAEHLVMHTPAMRTARTTSMMKG